MASTCTDCQPVSAPSAVPPAATPTTDPPSAGGPSGQSTTAGGPQHPAPPAAGQVEILPPSPTYPSLTIEFCDRCRWAPRATWIQTELFLTFPTPMIKRITLIPLVDPETGGRFRVWLDLGDGQARLVWDRKSEGGFPELKVLKQRIRNLISPDMGLGHSDKAEAVHKPFGVAPKGTAGAPSEAATSSA